MTAAHLRRRLLRTLRSTSTKVVPRWRLPGLGRVGGPLVPQTMRPTKAMPQAAMTRIQTAIIGVALILAYPAIFERREGGQHGWT